MNIIFPIAGYGKRTSKLGEYKPLVEVVDNYSILKICLLGIKQMIKPEDRLIFIFSRGQENSHSVSSKIKSIFEEINLNNCHIECILEETPPGQAHTVKNGLLLLDKLFFDDSAIILNSDQFIFFDIESVDKSSCGVGLYFNDSEGSCFFDIDVAKRKVIKNKRKRNDKLVCICRSFFILTLRGRYWNVLNGQIVKTYITMMNYISVHVCNTLKILNILKHWQSLI